MDTLDIVSYVDTNTDIGRAEKLALIYFEQGEKEKTPLSLVVPPHVRHVRRIILPHNYDAYDLFSSLSRGQLNGVEDLCVRCIHNNLIYWLTYISMSALKNKITLRVLSTVPQEDKERLKEAICSSEAAAWLEYGEW